MKNPYLFGTNSSTAKKIRRLAAPAILLFATLLPVMLFGQGPTISYSSPKIYNRNGAITPLAPTASGVDAPTGAYGSPTVLGSDFGTPDMAGIAVDAAGNVYVMDEYPDIPSAYIRRIGVNNSGEFLIASGFNAQASGIAVDKAGNAYVADQQNIWKVPATSPGVYGTPVKIDEGSFTDPRGVAVDGSGNIYVADFGSTAGKVYKMANDGTGLQQIDAGLTRAAAIAVDGSNNVYVIDLQLKALYELPAPTGAAGSGQVLLFAGFTDPVAVAVDPAGNAYVEDHSTGNTYQVPPGGATPFIIGNHFPAPSGLAIDASYNMYVSDPLRSGINKMSPTGGYFISPVLPAGLSIDSTTGIISGTPTTVTAAADYRVSAYNASGSALATVNIWVTPAKPTISYSSPQTYTAHVAVTPLGPSAGGDAVAAATGAYSSPVIIGSGLTATNSQYGLAMDAAGNMYVADQNAGGGVVKKITADGSSTTIIASGFSNIQGLVALDKAGNVYVADLAVVWKVPASGSPVTYGTPVIINNTFTVPFGIAADPAGNIYVTDLGNFSGGAGAGVYKMANDGTSKIRIDNGPSYPYALAVDAAQNVYLCDPNAQTLYEIPSNGGPQVQLASGISAYSIALDGAGNIYFFDAGTNTIFRIPPGGGSPVALTSAFFNAVGLAVDAAYNLYIDDISEAGINKMIPTGGYFISPALPNGLGIDAATGIISGTPTAVGAAADYIISAYNIGGGGSATVNIAVNPYPKPTIGYTGPQTYTTHVAITPLTPASSNVDAPTGVYTSPVIIGSGLTATNIQYGLAMDAAGNMYVADQNAGVGVVKKITADGSSTTIIASGFSNIQGQVALDKAGNVYIDDWVAVWKIPASGSPVSYGTPVIINNTFQQPFGIAADAAGNIYVVDIGNGASVGNSAGVYKIANDGTNKVRIDNGISIPQAVAVDAAGNVYVGSIGAAALYEIPAPTGVGGGPPAQLASGVSPIALALDAAGNIYIGDGSGFVSRVPAGGGSPVTITAALINPDGIAVDAAYNLYVNNGNDAGINKMTPTGGYFISPALPNGLSLDAATGAISGTPTAVGAAADYLVTAYNVFSGGSSATVNIRVVSNNANLAFMGLSGGAVLSPAFTTGNTSYTASVKNGITSVTVKPTASDPNAAAIMVNGNAVASGAASQPIPLNLGPNTITTAVTAQDGITTKTYTTVVTREKSTNANLSNLVLNSGPLSPTFNYRTTAYTASVKNNVTSVKIKPILSDPNATVKVNDIAISSNTLSGPMALNVGPNTITTTVTAADGTTTQSYTIILTREKSTNANLSNLVLNSGPLSPIFNYLTTSYTASVKYGITSVKVIPTTSDPAATVTVNGSLAASKAPSDPIALNVGPNTITTTVTAADGTTMQSYTIILTRQKATNANLSNLVLNSGPLSPAFNYLTTAYTASVKNNVTSVKVTPILSDPNATVKVNNVAVISHTLSGPVALNVGPNTINAVVTAADGITTQTYAITVTRAAPDNAKLSSVNLRPFAPLTVVAGPGYRNFTASVTNAIASVSVVAVTADPLATLTVNGNPATSGTASTPVTLNVGDNVITTVVTAQDATTSLMYIITVNRAAAPGLNNPFQALSVKKPTESLQLADDGIAVHQAISPNGDGVNDFLTIDGITNYPDNKLRIMNRAGTLVYEGNGYDNTSRVFDGHSNKTGAMQQSGTYFYSLDYKVKGVNKHKTGFIILKW